MRDLRGLIEDWRAAGQLKIVEGADADLDIGALAEVSGSGTEPPALLFDKIKGYPDGYRVLINMFQTQRRTAESLVATIATHSRVLIMPDAERAEFLDQLRAYLSARPETSSGEFTLPMITGVLRAIRQ